jgi:transcriptional regulator with XRE-family HTH domain
MEEKMRMPEGDDYARELGNRLREVRRLLGITEHEAASAAGITIRTWRRWEAGLPGRGHNALLRFAKNLEVSAGWLIVNEGTPFPREIDRRMYAMCARGVLNDAGQPFFREMIVWH